MTDDRDDGLSIPLWLPADCEVEDRPLSNSAEICRERLSGMIALASKLNQSEAALALESIMHRLDNEMVYQALHDALDLLMAVLRSRDSFTQLKVYGAAPFSADLPLPPYPLKMTKTQQQRWCLLLKTIATSPFTVASGIYSLERNEKRACFLVVLDTSDSAFSDTTFFNIRRVLGFSVENMEGVAWKNQKPTTPLRSMPISWVSETCAQQYLHRLIVHHIAYRDLWIADYTMM